MKVAFLGLGAMGTPIAAHLARHHSLTVWNLTQERATAFAAKHSVQAAATPREAVIGADMVLTCLPTSREVEALLDGPDGLMAGLASGSVWLDCTSGDPSTSRRIAERLAQNNITFADCPVSGGVGGAEAGTLTIMVGADKSTLACAEPVLRTFSSKIEHMGPVGTGHAMKAINNALFAASVQAFAEGVTALVKAGVSARQAVNVLNSSSGRSFFSETIAPGKVLSGSFPHSFRLALLDKDVRIALGLLQEQNVDAPLLGQTSTVLRAARAELGEDADFLDTIRHVERKAGTQIRG